MIWSSQTQSEEPITGWGKTDFLVYDWSPDGKFLLLSKRYDDNHREIWEMPLSAAPHAETAARQVAADAAFQLWQPHYSPDGRWIVFEAVLNTPTAAVSKLFVIPASGGPWRPVAEGKGWDDKPRWSPDGKTIYFVSRRGGFFNVWGIRLIRPRERRLGGHSRCRNLKIPY